MGRDRALPGSAFLSTMHPRLKTPVNATLLVTGLSIALAWLTPEEVLLKPVNFGALSAFMPLNVTAFLFLNLRQKRYRNVFSQPVFPALGLAIVGFAWSGFDRTTYLFGGAWLLVGLMPSSTGVSARSSLWHEAFGIATGAASAQRLRDPVTVGSRLRTAASRSLSLCWKDSPSGRVTGMSTGRG